MYECMFGATELRWTYILTEMTIIYSISQSDTATTEETKSGASTTGGIMLWVALSAGVVMLLQ